MKTKTDPWDELRAIAKRLEAIEREHECRCDIEYPCPGAVAFTICCLLEEKIPERKKKGTK